MYRGRFYRRGFGPLWLLLLSEFWKMKKSSQGNKKSHNWVLDLHLWVVWNYSFCLGNIFAKILSSKSEFWLLFLKMLKLKSEFFWGFYFYKVAYQSLTWNSYLKRFVSLFHTHLTLPVRSTGSPRPQTKSQLLDVQIWFICTKSPNLFFCCHFLSFFLQAWFPPPMSPECKFCAFSLAWNGTMLRVNTLLWTLSQRLDCHLCHRKKSPY